MKRSVWFRGAVLLMAWAVVSGAAVPASSWADTLRTEPPGTRVSIRGPVSVGGTGNIPLDNLPGGRFRLLVEGPGRAHARGTLRADGRGALRVGGYGGPGGLLSPPGLGHLQRGETGRGLVLLGGGGASLGAALVQALSRADAEDDLQAAQRRYDLAVSEDELIAARGDLIDAQNRFDDEEEMTALWGGVAAWFWLGSAAETWLLTPRPDLAPGRGSGDYVVRSRPASPFGAGIRSVLFPGAGQRYGGRDARGNRFTLGVAVLGAGALLSQDAYLEQRREQVRAQRNYDLADTEDEAERRRRTLDNETDDVRTVDRLRWGLVAATGAVYLWNILDAVRMAGAESAPASLSWRVSPHGDGWRAGLAWRLQ